MHKPFHFSDLSKHVLDHEPKTKSIKFQIKWENIHSTVLCLSKSKKFINLQLLLNQVSFTETQYTSKTNSSRGWLKIKRRNSFVPTKARHCIVTHEIPNKRRKKTLLFSWNFPLLFHSCRIKARTLHRLIRTAIKNM